MSRRDFDAEDRVFEELFSALDGISASEELKARTLDTILGEERKPQLTVVEGGVASGNTRKVRCRPSLLPRVAAIAVVLVLATGGIAYAVPVSHVTMISGDTTIDLGINVFGVTVGTSADTDEGIELLEGLDVRGAGYEDAMERVADRLEERRAEDESIEVRIDGTGPQREAIVETADRLMEQRNARHEEIATDPEVQVEPRDTAAQPWAPANATPAQEQAPRQDGTWRPMEVDGWSLQDGTPQGMVEEELRP
ncbi:MAG: hypothetical protein K5859_09090 [Atopobiaceae bacterium]|nr:hypothetical protein [Atopobiaceae bacterium]